MVDSPLNTTAAVQHRIKSGDVSVLFEGMPASIEASEAAGQRQLVESQVLPVECGAHGPYFELGFEFGPGVEGDDLFWQATLPSGWKREASSHPMWSYIVDERGVRRVSVFYKAAFYDRKAHMHIDNVGRSLGSELYYADDPEISEREKRPIDLAVYTPEEIEDARTYLRNQIKSDHETIERVAQYGRGDKEHYEQGIARAEAALVKLEGL